MISMILLVASALVSIAISMVAYAQSRNFVTRKLRYVDAVQSWFAPWVAGAAVGLLALPLVGILPILGVGTAITLGLSVGLGVASGARDVRHNLPGY